jgi:DNA-directed RNA polymerase
LIPPPLHLLSLCCCFVAASNCFPALLGNVLRSPLYLSSKEKRKEKRERKKKKQEMGLEKNIYISKGQSIYPFRPN